MAEFVLTNQKKYHCIQLEKCITFSSNEWWTNLNLLLPFSSSDFDLISYHQPISLSHLFSSPQYQYIFDELLVHNYSPVDTGYGGKKEKNEKQNEMKYMKILSLLLKMTQVISRSLFPFPLRWRQKFLGNDIIISFGGQMSF